MPEITLTSTSTTGWNTEHRTDLPPYDRLGTLQDGATSSQPVNPTRAGLMGLNQRTYKYVDTDKWATSTGDVVLWSDSATWCTMAAFWKAGRAGLAHVVPGSHAGQEINDLMASFGETPTEIYLVTMPAHFGRADGFQAVRNAISTRYGPNYANIKVYLINGYAGKQWESKHQLGVDPRMGAYPVFN
jgi:hypothetical protein